MQLFQSKNDTNCWSGSVDHQGRGEAVFWVGALLLTGFFLILLNFSELMPKATKLSSGIVEIFQLGRSNLLKSNRYFLSKSLGFRHVDMLHMTISPYM